MRTKRGADISSDHHLVVIKMKLKLKKQWTTEQTTFQNFTTAFLPHTNTLNQFKITFNNSLQVLKDLFKEEKEAIIEDNWNRTSTNFNMSEDSVPQETSS
ncbi:unnamed protein product [Schistosoma mattheei]|uniref:Uncharacterized protein n=1 Tax=Schistosoma mattheei TaxID=31246 RepID=A0A183NLH0_9TREM|nr:unnamed protein product [Schistosoma mattheei]